MIRAVLLVALGRLEWFLDQVEAAEARIELRRFLKDNPTVTVYPPRYPDGG